MKALWFLAGMLALAAGMVGVVTPGLPTVPLILLAAYCFAKSSQRWHDWLLNHAQFGPMIRDWRENGAISRKAKYYASLSIFAAFLISVILGLSPVVLGIQALVLLCVSVFIWTRPDQ